MKRSFTLQSVICICMLSLALSCHKRGEFEVPCKLLKMSYVERGAFPTPHDDYSGTVSYNAWGDPTQVIWTIASTGRPHYYFNYDKKRRLVRFDQMYSPTNVETVKVYIYEGDKIVGDSTFYWASDINNFRGTAQLRSTTKYFYDSKGRISKIEEWNGSSLFTLTYPYDAAGNLMNDGATYDNKTNFLRTNAWFMFVTRNFSKNNYRVADAYNKKGLPLTYQNTTVTFFNAYLNEFEYSCDHKYH